MESFLKSKNDIEINDSLSLEQKILGFYLFRKNVPDFSSNVKNLFDDKEGYRIALSNIIMAVSNVQHGIFLLKSFKSNEKFSEDFKLHCHSLILPFIHLISPFLINQNMKIGELCNALMYYNIELKNLIDHFWSVIVDLY